MSKLHRPESLIRRKDSDFMDERGHWWFAFDCPSESRAAERHNHDYLVRDDGAEARCSCPYAGWDQRACTLVLCAADIARAEREREAGGPPADPGGAALTAAQAGVDSELDDWMPAYPHPLPTLDEAVELAGNRWIQSRTAAGVRLTCTSCRAVRGWATEVGAIDWLATDGRCGCGGRGPTPPAPGAARKPLDECLHDLYGG
jgi:hypothetical protein